MDFDLNLLRAAVTVLSFATFVCIVVWALARRNRADFDEAANLPFLDQPPAAAEPLRRSGPAAFDGATRDE